MVIPNRNDRKVLVQRLQVDVETVLIVPSSVVVKRGELGGLGWDPSNGGSTGTVLVDVVSEVDDVVCIVVYNRAGVG